MKNFAKWIDTLVYEKGIDLELVHEIDGPSGPNWMPLAVVVEAIKAAPSVEQRAIRNKLVLIDFRNASVEAFLLHLARALAR